LGFAEREFALTAPDDKGNSYREHLEGQLARARTDTRRAEIEAELALPPFPAELAYLWRTFVRLRRHVGNSGFGPARLGWADIDAFNRMSGLRLAAWEVEIIETLDDLLWDSRQKDIGNEHD